MNLKEFRKQYPQYNDIADLELADSLYEKNYTDINKQDYYKELFPNIAERKDIKVERLKLINMMHEMKNKGMATQPIKKTKKEILHCESE